MIEVDENKLIPVENWAAFMARGCSMRDVRFSEIMVSIKDCLLAAFAPHLSKIPPTTDGRTMVMHLESLAAHLIPAVERLLDAAPHEEHRVAIQELRAEIAALKEQMATQSSGPIPRFFRRKA